MVATRQAYLAWGRSNRKWKFHSDTFMTSVLRFSLDREFCHGEDGWSPGQTPWAFGASRRLHHHFRSTWCVPESEDRQWGSGSSVADQLHFDFLLSRVCLRQHSHTALPRHAKRRPYMRQHCQQFDSHFDRRFPFRCFPFPRISGSLVATRWGHHYGCVHLRSEYTLFAFFLLFDFFAVWKGTWCFHSLMQET